MIAKLKTIFKYLTHEIWFEDIDVLNKKRLRGIRFLRISMLIGNGFAKDQCALHSSSLTFISLLSFVPVLAICFIFANMMGATDMLHVETKNLVRRIAEAPLPLEEEITKLANVKNSDVVTTNDFTTVEILETDVSIENNSSTESAVVTTDEASVATIPQDEEMDASIVDTPVQAYNQSNAPKSHKNGVVTVDTIDRLIDVAYEKINRINYRALGIVGFIFFAWTVFGLLEKIELAFNSVWKQKEQRPILKKLRDYSVILFIVPVLCLLAFLIPMLNILIDHISKFDGGFIGTLVDNSFTRFIMIFALLSLAFAVIHKAVPYTKVRFKAAIFGGVFTAIGFVLWFKLCLSFQIGVAKYSAAFGSFAMVPIILFWVYISWQIILLGAEITYAIQNWKTNRLPSELKK